MKRIKIGCAALNTTPLDWVGNRARIAEALVRSHIEGVNLLLLPELAITGYGCEDAFFSEDVTRRAFAELLHLAEHTAASDMLVAVGLPLLHNNSLYNVVGVCHDGRVLGLVAKQALAGDGIHYEPRWFKPWPDDVTGFVRIGDDDVPVGDLIFEWNDVRIGFEICEDAWNGTRPAQQHYLSNVDIILNPSASHFALGKTHIRADLVREASRSFACTYAYTNLLGNEAGRVIYDGESIIAQQGEILARAERLSYHNVTLTTAVVDATATRLGRKKSFSFRPRLSSYLINVAGDWIEPDADTEVSGIAPFESKEQEFYLAETLGLFDYVRKSRSRGFVVSLSGGADSSACAVLSHHAFTRALAQLGPEAYRCQLAYWPEPPLVSTSPALTCVYQSTAISGEATLTSARELAAALGCVYHEWSIEGMLRETTSTVEAALGRTLTWQHDDLALQNVQARVRAPGVWMLANLAGALLLTTSNRSEAAVGYATMDGDTAGGLAPLGGIDKAFLLHWLRWAEAALELPALSYVNALTPTAELRPARDGVPQTDEADLMPYPVLDRIERCAIHHYLSPRETYEALRHEMQRELGLEPKVLASYIARFFRLWARNQWKRERYAPAFHLDDANLDPRTWCRFPILSGSYEEELKELEASLAK
jgi:NAD+ synthase (glutamine-hydrolysing)